MSLKKLTPGAVVTAAHYNALLAEIQRQKILPGFGIQLTQTSAGTGVSIDHGGVISAGGSGGGGEMVVGEVFPAMLAAGSTATLVSTGRYKYKFYLVQQGLNTGGEFLLFSTLVDGAYNMAEVTTAVSSAAGDTLVMMFRTNEPGVYVFSL